MSKLAAWAGHAYLAQAMVNHGWEVVTLPLNVPWLRWEDVTQQCGRPPDLFIYGDMSRPPFLLDIERWPCPTLFYAVDSHIHSWYPLYAQAFDLCCVAMRDHLPSFLAAGRAPKQTRWLPLFARARDTPPTTPPDPEFKLLFVGKNDPVITPGRHAFLQELEGLLPPDVLSIRTGAYWQLYPKAMIVLNVSEHGDLNFRVFEALGCGACLLTPQVGQGLEELFTPGRHLFTYAQGNAAHAAAVARELLADPSARQATATAGLAAVDAGHRYSHRAAQLLDWLAGQDLGFLVGRRLEHASALHRAHLRLLYLHFAETAADSASAAMYLRQARR